MNYFELFKLPVSLEISMTQLNAAYFSAQQKAHPDQQAVGAAQTTTVSSAQLNAAYQTLKDPLRRAIYWLQLQGVELDEKNVGSLQDQDVLQQAFKRREMLADANSRLQKKQLLGDVEADLAKHPQRVQQAAMMNDIVAVRRAVLLWIYDAKFAADLAQTISQIDRDDDR